jgi:hypothetical protein
LDVLPHGVARIVPKAADLFARWLCPRVARIF